MSTNTTPPSPPEKPNVAANAPPIPPPPASPSCSPAQPTPTDEDPNKKYTVDFSQAELASEIFDRIRKHDSRIDESYEAINSMPGRVDEALRAAATRWNFATKQDIQDNIGPITDAVNRIEGRLKDAPAATEPSAEQGERPDKERQSQFSVNFAHLGWLVAGVLLLAILAFAVFL